LVTIGTACRLTPNKSVDTLILAASNLRNRRDVRFTVIGDGPEKERLLQMVRLHDLEDQVIFADWQEPLLPALRELDVFVLTSLSEACPLTMLEAMALGLPVVATRVGGIPEIVLDGQTGLLVPPMNPLALAKALATLVDSSELRGAMGMAGRCRAIDLFSEGRMVTETQHFYQRMLQRKLGSAG
jgi:glycosyltransferase involved in cell wall biosynthesis